MHEFVCVGGVCMSLCVCEREICMNEFVCVCKRDALRPLSHTHTTSLTHTNSRYTIWGAYD